ncbi:hypothetical protein [Mycolicibacterium peregrinum]|uniref:hypothetical protein n=1 Tax=Mycolicibacterium peregrinum TaxID=43304 RepID=UPI0013F4D2B1|nr:hypothetical protein [Mycolicibacterium peregrinum]
MDVLRRKYDLVSTVGTGGVLMALDTPWPWWAVYGVKVTLQIGNRIVRSWAR